MSLRANFFRTAFAVLFFSFAAQTKAEGNENDLEKDSPPADSWLGVSVREIRRQLTITRVIPKTPADGLLRVGDVIKAVDGLPPESAEKFENKISFQPVGKKLHFSIVRDEQKLRALIAPEKRPTYNELANRIYLRKPAPKLGEGLIFLDALGNGVIRESRATSKNLFQNKVTVFFHWGSWDPYCEEILPILKEWEKNFGQDGLKIIAVSPDSPEVLKRYFAQRAPAHPPMTLVSTYYGSLGESRYAALNIPTLLIADKRGNIRFAASAHYPDLNPAQEIIIPKLLGRR